MPADDELPPCIGARLAADFARYFAPAAPPNDINDPQEQDDDN